MSHNTFGLQLLLLKNKEYNDFSKPLTVRPQVQQAPAQEFRWLFSVLLRGQLRPPSFEIIHRVVVAILGISMTGSSLAKLPSHNQLSS
jgi:hypothetical protein